MIKIFFFFLTVFCGIAAQAQQVLDNKELFLKQNARNQTYLSHDGRYLALDIYRLGHIKRHRFFVGDHFKFKLKHQRKYYRESIVAISDSSFTFSRFNNILNEAEYTEIKLSEVRKVRLQKRIPWVTEGAYILPMAGGVFLFTDTFIYRGGLDFQINFDPKTALIAGGIASLGILCAKLSFPAYRINARSQLKVLRVY